MGARALHFVILAGCGAVMLALAASGVAGSVAGEAANAPVAQQGLPPIAGDVVTPSAGVVAQDAAPDGGSASSSLKVPQDFSTIQAAIDAASPGDTVDVAPGLYHERIDNHSKAITIQSTGGAGVTTIDGGAAGTVARLIASPGETPVLRGFTITNGDGGGVYTSGGPALIESNIISGNHNCAGNGAGIQAFQSSATIRGNTISNNTKQGCSGGTGGGGVLFEYPGSATVEMNVITGNVSAGDGGGISMWGVATGLPTIRGNTIKGNTAACSGGGISLYPVDAVVENNVIAGNIAGAACTPGNGGGVYSLALWGSQGSSLVNNTISGNTARGFGSALYADGNAGNAKVLNNVLVGSGSQTVVYCGDYYAVIPPSISFNDVYSTGSGSRYGGLCSDLTGINGNISADPLFVNPVAELRLGCGSPAVDAGTSTGAPTTDIEGTPRPLDGNGDLVTGVDMGAYERGQACAPPGSSAPTLVAPTTVTAGSPSAVTAAFFVSGVGLSGATVKIYDGASLVATASSDASGVYSAGVTLGVGSHSLTATQTVDGLTGEASPAVPVTVSPPGARQGGKLTGGGEVGAGGFGHSVALSADGNTALVGGPDDGGGAGAAWVFTQAGGTWLQQGVKLTGGGEIGAGGFGYSVALSADGNTALVGGYRDNSFIGAGWVFTRSGGTWKQEGSKLTGGGEDGAGSFGVDVTLSADGNTALVGGPDDDDGVGAVWVFARSGGTWSQQGAKLTGSGESGSGGFGGGVAVSSDGNTALVGGPFDNASSEVGAAWVFTRSGGVWSQQGSKLTGAGVPAGGWFGWSAALSGDGNTALIGSYPDSSFAGATWVFTRSGGTWSPQSAPVGGGASGGSYFGYGVALSSDGNTAVVGGPADNGNRGATWVFSRSGATWTQQGSKLTGSDASGTAYVGVSVSVSAAGNTVLAGGPGDSGNAGAAWVFAAAGGPVPAAPTGVAAVPGVGKASVSFTPPAGPVSGYTVIAVPSGATATGTSSPIVVTGLTNGTTYTFRVVAANAGGMGPASAASNEVIPGFPTRPTAVTAVADDARATVRWTAPASDGGSAITGYVVTPYIGAVAQTPIPVGPLTGTTVTGLTNDTTYTFTVTAVNAVGAGAASAASNAVTPNVQGREPPEPPAPSLRPTVPDPPAGGMRPPLPGAG